MNILVTTPNGKVGSEIVKNLVTSGASVRVAVHRPESAKAFDGLKVEVVPMDYANPSSFEQAVKGMDTVYLAFASTQDAVAPKLLIDAAKTAGVKRIVMLSAKGVENSETALWQVEEHLRASGLESTVLRPTWFFQNFNTGQNYYIKNLDSIIEASGDAKTSFIDTRDIAAVATKAILEDGHQGKAYVLTGATAYDRASVAAAISQATGKTITYVAQTDAEFRAQATQEKWDGAVIEIMSWLYGTVRNGWTADTTNTVQDLLGRAPIRLEQYAQDHKEAWL
jgi:uncharacterized protein YbjT (DUF2867 family)